MTIIKLVGVTRLERAASPIAIGARYQVTIGRARQTRTAGLIVPNDARYQLRYSPIVGVTRLERATS